MTEEHYNQETQEIEDYVRVTARMVRLTLAEDQVERVAVHLARTRALVAPLLDTPLHPELEPAEIYCPAPFPPGGGDPPAA